jgi:hypothetical protein
VESALAARHLTTLAVRVERQPAVLVALAPALARPRMTAAAYQPGALAARHLTTLVVRQPMAKVA